jgi:2,3-bisphosphoglycerate-independent phosphoglycerate mutase
MHFIGLFSDGNVHSHIDHLRAMILRAKEEGVKDGADSHPARRA